MELKINIPIPQDQVTKVVHDIAPGHVFVELFYPNGVIVTADMRPDGTVVAGCNKPLRQEADGSYTPILE